MNDDCRKEIVCQKPNREMTLFQRLMRHEQNGFIVDRIKAKRILEIILRRTRND